MPKGDTETKLKRMYNTANHAALSAKYLMSKDIPVEFQGPFGVSGLVLSALSSELSFKCLIVIEGKPFPHIHNLQKLYNQLSIQMRKRIKEDFEVFLPHLRIQAEQMEAEMGSKQPRNFAGMLKAGADAFVQWRYLHEADSNLAFFLTPLPQILQKIIMEARPDWPAPNRVPPSWGHGTRNHIQSSVTPRTMR